MKPRRHDRRKEIRIMKIVYMGTPEFAVATLEALIKAGHEIVGVVTMPDKPAGRGQKMTMSAVKEYAVGKGLRVLQPEKLKDESFVEELRSLGAELQVVVAFRMLPEVVWSMPKYGTMNIHASLLPNYRGAAPINWAVINGEKKTGVTSFLLKHDIDTGDIIASKEIDILPTDNAGTVHNKLMMLGAELAVESIAQIESGTAEMKRQDDIDPDTLKKAPKIFKDDMRIDWGKSSESVVNLIRGLSPYPAAWTILTDVKGKEYQTKVFAAEKVEGVSLSAGEVSATAKTLTVGTGDGAVRLTELQLSGKTKMKTEVMLQGFHIDSSIRLK